MYLMLNTYQRGELQVLDGEDLDHPAGTILSGQVEQ